MAAHTNSGEMIKAGILSDTHLSRLDAHFQQAVEQCFADCQVIIHAGDLTDIGILRAFGDKQIHCVHGNMCNHGTYKKLPAKSVFTLGGFTFGLTHGAGLGHDIEASLWNVFPEADCVIYGHTHRAVIHRQGGGLVINPGSFRGTGRYGAPGTYVIMEVGEELRAAIHNVPHI